jgi:membrane-bound metal-dependent hydrolase YbcI (DUF457 family)
MDIISHVLTGAAISSICNCTITESALIILAAVLPDTGEIFIQLELKKKTGITLTYNTETDDKYVSSNIKITWMYDLFHSLFVWALILMLLSIAGNNRLNLLVAFSGFLHVVLDLATHGKVWALKLLFPFSNKRYIVLGDTIGNWWQWKPFLLVFKKYKLPWYCVFYWLIISLLIFI